MRYLNIKSCITTDVLIFSLIHDEMFGCCHCVYLSTNYKVILNLYEQACPFTTPATNCPEEQGSTVTRAAERPDVPGRKSPVRESDVLDADRNRHSGRPFLAESVLCSLSPHLRGNGQI